MKLPRIYPALFLVLGLTGCGVPEAQHQAVIAEREALAEALKASEDERAASVEAIRAEAEAAAEATRKEIESLRSELEATKRDAEVDRKALETEFEAYKKKFRVSARARARGMKLERLATVGGKIYEGVVLREVDAERVSFVHESGSGSVMLAELEPVLRAQLGYDEAESASLIHERELERRRGLAENRVADPDEVVNGRGLWEKSDAELAARQSEEKASRAALLAKRGRLSARLDQIKLDVIALDNAIIANPNGANASEMRAKKSSLEREFAVLSRQLSDLE